MMRTFLIALTILLFTPVAHAASPEMIVSAAQDRTKADVRYDPKYVKLDYPGGDVSPDTGVCTDVIIRSYRSAFGFDFQKAVHEDMRANFSAYPKTWGLKRPDRNIDHRRVPNLEVFLKRKGAQIPIGKTKEDYKPGDIVTWRLDGRLPHIGIVTNRTDSSGKPLVVHNIGSGPLEDGILFTMPTYRHFRFFPNAQLASNVNQGESAASMTLRGASSPEPAANVPGG